MSKSNYEQTFAIGEAVLKLCGIEDKRHITKMVLTVDWVNGCPPTLELTEQAIDCHGDPEQMIQQFSIEPIGEKTRVNTPGPSNFMADDKPMVEAMREAQKDSQAFRPQLTNEQRAQIYNLARVESTRTGQADRDGDILDLSGMTMQEPCAGTPQPLGIMTRLGTLRPESLHFGQVDPLPIGRIDCPDCQVNGVPTGEYQGLNSVEKCRTCDGTREVAK